MNDNSDQTSSGIVNKLATPHDNEIDLVELSHAVWRDKWMIAGITFLFATMSVFYALSLSNVYKSEALLTPTEEESDSLGIPSQLGGLANLAGVNIGAGGTNKTGLALEIMKSRAFVFKFIKKYQVTADLMAAKNWNLNTNQIIYDEEVYNPKTKKWLREKDLPLLPKPSLQESYDEFRKIYSVTQDEDTSMVNISIEHYSPYIAQKWVSWLINDINEEMKTRDLQEAKSAISYLNTQLESTNIADFQTMLYQLIEEQTKTVMFANVREQYILKTIDPALAPELKVGPKRAIICLIGTILGGLISVIVVLIRYFINSNKKVNNVAL